MALAVPAVAQERSAGQSYDAQVNYGALNAKLQNILDQNQVIAGTVTSLNTTVTSLTTTVKDLSDKNTKLQQQISQIAACNNGGRLWTGSSCVAMSSFFRIVGLDQHVPTSGGNVGVYCNSNEVSVSGGAQIATAGTTGSVMTGNAPYNNGWVAGGWARTGQPHFYIYTFCLPK